MVCSQLQLAPRFTSEDCRLQTILSVDSQSADFKTADWAVATVSSSRHCASPQKTADCKPSCQLIRSLQTSRLQSGQWPESAPAGTALHLRRLQTANHPLS